MLTKKEYEVLKERQQGKTQVEVAELLGISQAAVSNFEKNAKRKIFDAKKTLKIAMDLGISEEDEPW